MVLSFLTKIAVFIGGVFTVNYALLKIVNFDLLGKLLALLPLGDFNILIYILIGIMGVLLLAKYNK
jgi:uncharacterized membrane protein YuzA (DUF378 family)